MILVTRNSIPVKMKAVGSISNGPYGRAVTSEMWLEWSIKRI